MPVIALGELGVKVQLKEQDVSNRPVQENVERNHHSYSREEE